MLISVSLEQSVHGVWCVSNKVPERLAGRNHWLANVGLRAAGCCRS
jgi:hypothetical protein